MDKLKHDSGRLPFDPPFLVDQTFPVKIHGETWNQDGGYRELLEYQGIQEIEEKREALLTELSEHPNVETEHGIRLAQKFKELRTALDLLPANSEQRERFHNAMRDLRADVFSKFAHSILKRSFGDEEALVHIGSGEFSEVYGSGEKAVLVSNTENPKEGYHSYLRQLFTTNLVRQYGVAAPKIHQVGMSPLTYTVAERLHGPTLHTLRGKIDEQGTGKEQEKLKAEYSTAQLELGRQLRILHEIPEIKFGWLNEVRDSKGKLHFKGFYNDWNEFLDQKLNWNAFGEMIAPQMLEAKRKVLRMGEWSKADLASSQRVIEEIRSWNLPPSLIHGDAHQGNMLLTSNGLVLIDWSFARGGAGIYEELAPWVTHENGEESLRHILQGYGIPEEKYESEIKRIKHFAVLRIMESALWDVIHRPNGQSEQLKQQHRAKELVRELVGG